jgi:4-alpha-glucanotransferase
LRLRKLKALASFAHDYSENICYYKFINWIFDLQWQDFKRYCKDKDVHLIGDIPLYVAAHSPDVWAHPEIFKLDGQGKPLVLAGVPPDLFSETGQLWNVPVYDWDELRKQNYTWWISRLRRALSHVDLLRLDHFIGFIRVYEIPFSSTTALHGEYCSSAGVDFFETIKRSLGSLPFIVDDLGRVTPEVKTLRDSFNLPGSWVLHFSPAADCPENCVVYTATHDTNTTVGWKHEGTNWILIEQAFASKAKIAMILMQDILGLDSSARMNFPGKKLGNWAWRMNPGGLSKSLMQKLHDLAKKYYRYKRDMVE